MIRVCYEGGKKNGKKYPVVTEQIKKDLQGMCRKFLITDEGFVIDLWLLVMTEGKALMSFDKAREKARKLADKKLSWISVYKTMMNQHGVLSKLRKLPYFSKLCSVPDKLDAVERLLTLFKKIHAKTQTSKCAICPQYLKCQAGRAACGGSNPANLKIAAGCKRPPLTQINIVECVQTAIGFLKMLADPTQGNFLTTQVSADGALLLNTMQQSSMAGVPTEEFDTTFTGTNLYNAIDKLVDELTQQQLVIFELARVFNDHLLPGGIDEKVESDVVADDHKPREIKSTEEILKAYPEELVDSDRMDKRLALGEIQVRQDMKREKKKQYFQVLLDVSGSMRDAISANMYALVNKASLASALCLSVMKKVQLEKGRMLFTFFAGIPDRTRIAEDYDAFADLSRQIGLCDFSGGGTDIQAALLQGCNNIRNQEKEGKGKAEILLITDGESYLSEPELVKAFGNDIKLHVLDVSPMKQVKGKTYYSTAYATLNNLAVSYRKIDPLNLDLNDIAKVVTQDKTK